MDVMRMHVEKLARLLGQFTYRYADEIQLHERISSVLDGAGYKFERERRIDSRNRFDFFVDGGIVIEVKVGCSASAALRQIDRYTKLDEVKAILLAATESWADRALAAAVRQRGWQGKAIALARLRRQVL